MANPVDGIVRYSINSWEQGIVLLVRLLDTARPSAVFSEPVQQGDYAVITASEVVAGLGFGFGAGGGAGVDGEEAEDALPHPEATVDVDSDPDSENEGGGGTGGGTGGGAGGSVTARPVAAISIGPTGVAVEPVVDVTKLGLAFFTMLGSAVFMWSRMRRASRSEAERQ